MTKSKYLSSAYLAITTFILYSACSPAMAQVQTNVNNKLNIFLNIITGAAVVLFTYYVTMAGYKFASTENCKFSDLRGLLIGGVLCATAGAIAQTLIS